MAGPNFKALLYQSFRSLNTGAFLLVLVLGTLYVTANIALRDNVAGSAFGQTAAWTNTVKPEKLIRSEDSQFGQQEPMRTRLIGP